MTPYGGTKPQLVSMRNMVVLRSSSNDIDPTCTKADSVLDTNDSESSKGVEHPIKHLSIYSKHYVLLTSHYW